LEDALADQNNEVQLSAAIALTQQKVPLPSTGVQIVIDIVKNKNERRAYSRAAAVHVLNHQEKLPPQALSVLEEALQDEDKAVKIGAAEIIESLRISVWR
jgi:HEAT repeat protein